MSELITPEEFINDKEFVKALKTINASLADLLKTFDALSTSVKGYYTEVNKGAKSNADLVKNQNLVNKSTKELTAAEKELERLRKDTEKTMAKRSVLNSQEYKDNVRAKKELRELTDAEAKRRGNIGKYKEDIVKAYVAIHGAVLLAKGAFNLFIDVLNSTGSTQDAFTATLEGWKQGFNAVKVAITTMDFKDFSKRVKDAIDEGRRYAEGLDEIDDKTRALEIAEAKLSNTILEQRKIQNSALSTQKEKIAAGEKIKKLEEDMQVIRTGIAKQAYDNEITNLASIANKTKNVTDAMRDEIVEYIERGERVQEQIRLANEFAVIQKEINRLREEEASGTTVTDNIVTKTIDNQEKILALGKTVTQEQRDAAEYINRVTLPTDEKYNILKQKTVDLERAKGSALENTLRIQSKLDSAISKDGGGSGESKEEQESKKTVARFEYTWKQKEKIQEDSLKRQWDAAEEALKVEYAGREVELADFKDKEKQKSEAVEEAEKQKQAAIEETKMLQIDSANAVFDLSQAFISREGAELESKRDKDLKAAGDNAKQKERIEADYQKKMTAIKRKAAIVDKVQALFNIGINTAVGVSKATAQLGAFGIPVIAWIKILGALQAAAVLAAPIPKFFKGVKDFKGGLATVGEKGMELVESPKGSFLTPDKATTMLLPEHSTVHTHEKTIEKLKGMDSEKVNELINEQRLTRKAIANQVHNSTTLTQDGLEYARIKGNSRTKMIDKYFRT